MLQLRTPQSDVERCDYRGESILNSAVQACNVRVVGYICKCFIGLVVG